ncbi:SLC13 family permease [Alkalimonas amylolytica]|uniref:Di-and tricarboxylate transporter n=1 Tax=Alkalimonas amylolytica TaxID=152573 RepID=A0A1H4CJB3_ALKAM|nr:SLC13 family permease [Alkalimonas amylolytica]SEA60400.1 Di-and tricarboxylate transporter [Alkalimonas amylolytica]
MNAELLLVLAMLLLCMGCFAANKPRTDVVALVVLAVFPLTGLLTVQQTLAGFSDPAVILIAALFVVGDGLVRTGIVYRLGDWLVRVSGNSEIRLLVLLMLSVAALGSIMSSTGVVAIFIPVVLSICARLHIAPGRLMMPLAFAALISGMQTLVATPPNMVVQSELQRQGLDGFHFFSFTPIGLVVLLLGVGYMLLARRWLNPQLEPGQTGAPRLKLSDLARNYRLKERELRLKVLPGSSLLDQQLNELALRKEFGINVVAIERQQKFRTLLLNATGNTLVEPQDILLVDLADPAMDLLPVCQQLGLEPQPLSHSYFSFHAHELGLAEVAFPPESSLPGKTIQQLAFRSQYKLNVVGLRRRGEALPGVLVDEVLQPADKLLVAGNWRDIHQLQQQSRDFLVLSLPAEVDEVTPAARKAPHALFCLALMVLLMVSGIVPNVVAALITCLLMGALRCIDLNSAYQAIHWPSLILIIGMLPFALALQQTGGIDLAVSSLLYLVGERGDYALLAALFVLTAVTGSFVSNTATAVLMAPVAVSLANSLGASPYPFAMMVALAASAAFMTPVSSPINTLVLQPGKYKFFDFVRIGTPFTLLVLLVSVLLVPLLFPLYPA